MAFTSAPTFSSQQLKRVPVEDSQKPGASIVLGSNYINCHPRKYKQWGTDPDHVIEKRPSLGTASFTGWNSTKVPRGMWSDNSVVYYVQDGNAYVATSGTTLGALQYTTGYVGITEYLISSTGYIIFLENHASAAYVHYYNLSTTAWTSVALGTGAAGDPIFLDGYLFYSTPAGNYLSTKQRIYNSTIGAPTTWSSGTDFLDAEMFPDQLVGIAKHRNHIVGFGRSTVEFFYDNANQYNSPLSRNQNYTRQIGVLPISYTPETVQRSPSAWVNVGDMIFFLGVSTTGAIGVYKLDNFEITNVSSAYLQRYLNASEVGGGASLYESANAVRIHSVNVRGMPSLLVTIRRTSSYKMYVYIIEENVWVEWQWTVNGHSFYPLFVSTWENYTYIIGDEYYSSASHYQTVSLDNLEESTPSESVTATVITDLYDFGTDNKKHFRYTDIVGDFGNNTITYSYTKNTDYSSFVSCGTINYNTWSRDTPVRFRGLGMGVRMSNKVVVTGPDNMQMHGIEQAYNQGQL